MQAISSTPPPPEPSFIAFFHRWWPKRKPFLTIFSSSVVPATYRSQNHRPILLLLPPPPPLTACTSLSALFFVMLFPVSFHNNVAGKKERLFLFSLFYVPLVLAGSGPNVFFKKNHPTDRARSIEPPRKTQRCKTKTKTHQARCGRIGKGRTAL